MRFTSPPRRGRRRPGRLRRAAATDWGEAFDPVLDEEEPDIASGIDDERPGDIAGDENAGEEDVDGLLLDNGPDPGAGRLVAEAQEGYQDAEPDLVARDVGIDGAAATA